ncbi:isochorismatase family protein [Paraconexibacter sp.]|uniref:isochorismatase family protein n=1 Tax=Paraconexibacter sp. TaxID=2949640 RepID=UPI0035630A9E
MTVLARDRTALVVVDVQEAFRPVIDGFDRVAAATAVLVRGAAALGLPVIVTEQYPRGLGATVPEVAGHLGAGTPVLEKSVFSAAGADGFDLQGRDQVLLCGIEAHVCVHQTAQHLLRDGVEVHVCTDAVSSRTADNRAIGLERAREAGASLTSVEMALLELCGRAGTEEFKTIQGLIK